jgi:hypothetical protein
MGLPISRSIIESHGGRLWAAPKDGRGASFYFSLPTTSEAAEAPPAGTDPVTRTPACAFDHNLARKIFEKIRKIANSE